MPRPSIGDRRLDARSSKNDSADLCTQRRGADLNRLRPDQRPGTGRSPTSSCALFGRIHRAYRLGRCLPYHVARPAVSDQCRSAARPANHRRNSDQPYPQHRHDGTAHPLCGRCCAVRCSTARPRQADRLHHDMTDRMLRIISAGAGGVLDEHDPFVVARLERIGRDKNHAPDAQLMLKSVELRSKPGGIASWTMQRQCS